MSKNKAFNNRLDDLFSDDLVPSPEPVEGAESPESRTSVQAPIAPVDSEPVPPERDALHPAPSQRTGVMGWDQYLNAIDRDERLGFTFEGEDIQPVVGPAVEGDVDIEVPLQIGDEILGALQMETDADFTESESELLSAIANQVAQHVENLRLLEQAEQYRAEAEQASRRLTQEGWEEYLQSPTAPARAYTYDQTRVIPIDPQVTDIATSLEDSIQQLFVRDEAIGQLIISGAERHDETAESLVNTVAERLSLHIENLRLLDETELSRQQLDKRAAELETVGQVSTAAATILDPQSLLQSVVDLTQYSFGLYHSSVYLLSETGETLELAAASGKRGHQMLAEGQRVHLYQDVSVIAKAARTRQIVIITDALEDPSFMKSSFLPNTRSELAVPLVVGEQLIGVFNVESDTAGRFTQEDSQTFSTLAAQTAVALRNAQLYAEQMETVARLRELDHLKTAFLANMSHELRTPLNSILGFTQVILEGLDGPLTEDMTMDLELIEKNGQHLLNLINEVLDMAKIEAGSVALSLEPVAIAEMLDDVLRTTSSLVGERDVVLNNISQLPPEMQIQADAVRLRQMLINMMGNAIKFTEQGSVTLDTQIINKKIRISVHDTGIGIPANKLESIFEAFSQVDTSTTRKAGGTGLGLPISRRLAEMHGGWLWAESTGVTGEGSAFYLEIPIDLPETPDN